MAERTVKLFLPNADYLAVVDVLRSAGRDDLIESLTNFASWDDGTPVAMTEPPRPTYRPGDRCVILPGGRVQHYDCDQHADGTITEAGRIISTR
jgi:hypothetical protein